MPKQRNHPHHHSAADRARRLGGLRLPLLRWSVRAPNYEYPPGWVGRPPWGIPRLFLFYGFYVLAAIITVAAFFACAGGIVLWQTLTGAR